MEFGTGPGYPPPSGGEGQINGSRMQQTERQQQGGSAYHQGQHQLNQGLSKNIFTTRLNLKKVVSFYIKNFF